MNLGGKSSAKTVWGGRLENKEAVRLHSFFFVCLFLSKRKLWPLDTHSGVDLS